jgi:hypothetical protein
VGRRQWIRLPIEQITTAVRGHAVCRGSRHLPNDFGGAVENLNVNRTDMPSVQSTITAKLQQDLRAHPARSASRSADLRNSRPLAATFSSLLVLLLIRQVSNWGVRHGGMG